MPKYITDPRLKVDRESYPEPPKELYIGLGWDEDKETKRKHYRQYYPDELENIKEIFPKASPFTSYDIIRGQSRGLPKGGLFSFLSAKKKLDESGQESTLKSVGKFKGIIEIESKGAKEHFTVSKKKMIDELIQNVKTISK